MLTKLKLFIFVALFLNCFHNLVISEESSLENNFYVNWNSILVSSISKKEKKGIVSNLINYEKISNNIKFVAILNYLETFDPSELKTKAEILSFWINVYNIAAIDLIIKNKPANSIKNLNTLLRPVWGKKAIIVNGQHLSLGYIEHQILRKLDEPLIHFGIVCASLSCPDLASKSYHPNTVFDQLEKSTASFLKNKTKGIQIDLPNKTIYASQIFKWFKADFKASGGVLNFIETHLNKDLDSFEIKYIPYNWDLNKM